MFYRHLSLYFLASLVCLQGLFGAHFKIKKVEELLPFVEDLEKLTTQLVNQSEKFYITPPYHPKALIKYPKIDSINPFLIERASGVVRRAILFPFITKMLERETAIAEEEKDHTLLQELTFTKNEVETLKEFPLYRHHFTESLQENLNECYTYYVTSPDILLDSALALFSPNVLKGLSSNFLQPLLGKPSSSTLYPTLEASLLLMSSYLMKKDKLANVLFHPQNGKGYANKCYQWGFICFYMVEGGLLYAESQYSSYPIKIFSLLTFLHTFYRLKGKTPLSKGYVKTISTLEKHKKWIAHFRETLTAYISEPNDKEKFALLKKLGYPDLVAAIIVQYSKKDPFLAKVFKEHQREINNEAKYFYNQTQNQTVTKTFHFSPYDNDRNEYMQIAKKNLVTFSYLLVAFGALWSFCASLYRGFF